jgi:predicted DNA-binding protein
MPKTEKPVKAEYLSIRVTAEEKEFLEDLAQRSDRSVAALIRIAVREYYIKGATA